MQAPPNYNKLTVQFNRGRKQALGITVAHKKINGVVTVVISKIAPTSILKGKIQPYDCLVGIDDMPVANKNDVGPMISYKTNVKLTIWRKIPQKRIVAVKTPSAVKIPCVPLRKQPSAVLPKMQNAAEIPTDFTENPSDSIKQNLAPKPGKAPPIEIVGGPSNPEIAAPEGKRRPTLTFRQDIVQEIPASDKTNSKQITGSEKSISSVAPPPRSKSMVFKISTKMEQIPGGKDATPIGFSEGFQGKVYVTRVSKQCPAVKQIRLVDRVDKIGDTEPKSAEHATFLLNQNLKSPSSELLELRIERTRWPDLFCQWKKAVYDQIEEGHNLNVNQSTANLAGNKAGEERVESPIEPILSLIDEIKTKDIKKVNRVKFS